MRPRDPRQGPAGDQLLARPKWTLEPSLNRLCSGTGCLGSLKEKAKLDGRLNRPPTTSSSSSPLTNYLPPDRGVWLNNTGLGKIIVPVRGGKKCMCQMARYIYYFIHAMHLNLFVFCISFYSTQSKPPESPSTFGVWRTFLLTY